MDAILNKKLFTLVLFSAVFVVALFLRTVNLSNYPVGFQIDEASLGYNAYSLLLTGKSDQGNFLPLYIDIFGDQRPTGYHFLAIPFVAVFGLTEMATRLPGALVGALTVFPLALVAYIFFKDKKIAVLSAVFLAISPWSIVLSRASAETIVALFFILIGFYLVFDSIQKKSTIRLIVGTIFLALSFFFYHTPRVFVPMLYLLSILFLFRPFQKIRNNPVLIKTVFSFVFLSVLALLLVFVIKGGTGRFGQVNIFGFPETKLIMEEQIREDGVARAPLLETRMFHNKIVNFSQTFANNYLAYFTGDFLFMNGGLPIWYKVDHVGLILFVEFPLILYGVYVCLRSKNKYAKLPLLWILVAPVTAAITVDDIPNLQRAIVLFPMLEIIAAVGLVAIMSRVSDIKQFVLGIKMKHILFAGFILLVVFNLLYFLHQYFIHGRGHRPWYRNNGFSQMMGVVNDSIDKYDYVVLTKTGGGYPLVLFYSKYNPATYQLEGSPRDTDYKGFGKFIFVPQECPSINFAESLPKGKILFVDRGTCQAPVKIGKTSKTYTTILREDGTPAFRVIY